MAQDFYSLFSPYGGYQTDEELLYDNPMLMAGLGLGGGFVASQTGGAPATSQVLSSFAQKVAAQDAANLAAQRAAFNPAIIGQNLPTGGVNPRPNIKSTTPLTPNKIIGGLNANPLSGIASNLLKGSAYTAAVTPNPIGDSTLTGAYNSAVAAGEDPATAAARLGTADTSIRGLDTSNREVDFMPDGTGVLNGVSLFTGGAADTGMNYADVVNADNARKAQEAQYAAAAQAEAIADANAFVPPLDFAGEIQNSPETYSGLVENNPFTSMGGTSVEDNQYTMEREAGNVAPVAQTNEVAPEEGFMSSLVGRLAEQFTQPAPYTPQGGGAEAETAFGATQTQPTLFREGLSTLSELDETPLTSPDSFQTEAPIAALQSQAEPSSPQAIFERIRAKGSLSPELIAAGESRAKEMGTTFDPETGFSRDPFLQYQQEQAPKVNQQGAFDMPMTGMRPINAETGEPLSQGVIDAAARAGLELPMGSVPLPQAPVNSVPMGRDETRARLGGMTLNQYLDAADGAVSGLRTDPQGRMIPSRGREAQDSVFAYDDMTRADAYRGYEDEASAREARQAARPDFGATISDRERRGTGEMSMADAIDMFGSSKAARAAILRQRQGLNPVTGNREKTAEERQLSTDILNAQLDKLKEVDPDKYEIAANTVDKFIADGGANAKDRSKLIGQILFPNQSSGFSQFMNPQNGGFPNTVEGKIDFAMTKNPGKTRAEVAAALRAKGIIQ